MTGSDLSSLPTGTATFLFTDIEGSTHLLQDLGAQFEVMLEQHHRIIREAISANDGLVVRTEGDAFFVSFSSATRAVAAATRAQQELSAATWPEGAQVRVRMGLHTGEATLGGDDYIGIDIHRAARIAAAGYGGQVLVSEATYVLVRDALPSRVGVRSLGEHRLKDLSRAERIYQLEIPGALVEFPPLRTLDAIPNNLPLQLTSFVGRGRELEEGLRLLRQARLVTLTGPGGTGKTRLSLQIAAEAGDDFPDGTFFVPLAPIVDSDMVPAAIVQALGLQDAGSRPPKERLLEYLREKQALLVLDNFEQVVNAAPIVADLLRASPKMKVLVSSRAALRVYGEQEFPVPPLSLPDLDNLPSAEGLSQYEAVQLFIERAAAAKPDFAVTNDNAPAVAGICSRLDGLPLAIELAAARIRMLPPRAMLARLEHALPLLAGGSRDLPERQQTLRGAVAWSYDLLDERTRRLMERFSVFRGGATLDLAERVCGPASDLGVDVFDGLATLVEQSLLRQSEVDDEPRFGMLETIREFAVERLDAGNENEIVAERHAQAMLELAERAAPHLTGPEQRAWLDRLERENDNLRAALVWFTGRTEGEFAARLAFALWRFWQMRGYLHEGRERITAIIKILNGDNVGACALAFETAGSLAYWQGDIKETHKYYERALECRRELGNKNQVANALYNLGFAYGLPGIENEALWEMSMGLQRESLALYRELGDRAGIAKTLWGLGSTQSWRENFEAAREAFVEAVALFREQDDRFGLAWGLHMLALTNIKTGLLREGEEAAAEALTMFEAAGDVSGVVLLLDEFAELAAAEHDVLRALTLSGAAVALVNKTGVELASVVNRLMRSDRPSDLADADQQGAFEAGKRMTLADSIAFALKRGSN